MRLETANRDRQPHHVAWRHLTAPGKRALPAGVLVLPDQRGCLLWSSEAEPGWTRGARERFESVVSSPLRAKLLERLANAYAVIILFEGRDEEANRKVRQIVEAAIGQIEAGLATLPKAIARPPVILACAPSSLAQEAVLRASLGLDPTRLETAHVAVVYGRARRIGPLIEGKDLTAARLVDLLSVIGADCECGLDLTQTRGTPLPVRWGPPLQAQAARALGFDPESPMVKAEASRILAGQGSGTRRGTGRYREVSLGEDVVPAPPGSPAGTRNPQVRPRRLGGGTGAFAASADYLDGVVWTALGLIGLVAVVGGLLWRRYRQAQRMDRDE